MVEPQKFVLKSFIPYDEHHPFPLENIPFGTFVNPKLNKVHCCTRVGEYVVDLAVLEQHGIFDDELYKALERKDIFSQKFLNEFISLGKPYWSEARRTLQRVLGSTSDKLNLEHEALFKVDEV